MILRNPESLNLQLDCIIKAVEIDDFLHWLSNTRNLDVFYYRKSPDLMIKILKQILSFS